MDINPEDKTSLQPNTIRCLLSMWRMNTVPNIVICMSLNPKPYRATISFPPQQLLELINHLLIHLIRPVKMKNTWGLIMWLKQPPDEAIPWHTYWQLQRSIWIHRLNTQRPGGKWIWILMITTMTQWRLAVHFEYRISPTGGVNQRKHTQHTPVDQMWDMAYSLSCHTVSEWRPAVPIGKMLSAGGRHKPQERLFVKKS